MVCAGNYRAYGPRLTCHLPGYVAGRQLACHAIPRHLTRPLKGTGYHNFLFNKYLNFFKYTAGRLLACHAIPWHLTRPLKGTHYHTFFI